MASNTSDSSEVLHHFLFFDVLKDGTVNVFNDYIEFTPPTDDPITGVKVKDAQITPQVSARVFLPPVSPTDTKLPVLLYIHGGGFCMRSPFSPQYTNYVINLVAQSKVLAVSVQYGLFPARPIPACYDDSWAALQWISSHANGSGPDEWLNRHADLGRLFIAGNSSGGNICHTLAVWESTIGLPEGVKISGVIMVQPYFAEDDKMWMYMCPENEGPRDRRMKPAAEDLARIRCGRVLVVVGGNDYLRNAGVGYVEELKMSGWKGKVELMENEGREHAFHLRNPEDEEAFVLQDWIVSFIQHQG